MSETRTPRPARRGPGPRVAEKPKDFKAAVGKLVRFCKPYAWLVLTAVALDMVSVILRLIGPNKISDITNALTEGLTGTVDMPYILRICRFLVVIYVIGAVLSFLTGVITTFVNQRVSKSLRGAISVKINRLPIGFFHKTTTGDVLSRVTNDVDTIGMTLQNSITSLVSAFTMLIGSLFMMFYTNWVMAVTAVLSSLVGFALMLLIMSKSQRYFTAQQQWLGAMNGHVEEIYTGHNVVRVFNGQAKEKAKFDEINRKMYESNWKSQFFSGMMQPVMSFIGNFGYVAVCIVGAVMTMNGQIPFGVIVAFMMYIRQFTNPLSQLAQAATNLQSTAAASERVFEFLDAGEMPDESGKAPVSPDVRGEVEFRHIRFGYEPGQTIIHDFSEHVMPGQKIAIVGPTGAGKTTLVNLLMRFYEPESGEILIDGVSASQMRREDVHAMFDMVLQDTWLFEGTIRENVAYGKEDAPLEDVVKACQAVGLHKFIMTLPQGYDTVINDKMGLSQGQRQLLTIARSIVQDAPMLILDEATSSVDTRTEVMIQRAMDALTVGRTSFVIAHRLSTIRNADKILVLRDGDVVESGNHDELMAKGGFYADLYNSQFDREAG